MSPEVRTAFEFGFRCAEKGMNLEAAFNRLEEIYSGQPVATPRQESVTATCSSCGKPFNIGHRQCGYCGDYKS